MIINRRKIEEIKRDRESQDKIETLEKQLAGAKSENVALSSEIESMKTKLQTTQEAVDFVIMRGVV